MFLHSEQQRPKAVIIGPMPSKIETDAEFFAGLESLGEAAVRAEVENSASAYRRGDKWRWLHEKELARQVATIAAATASAEAAQKSARWAIWSVVIAVVALIVAVYK